MDLIGSDKPEEVLGDWVPGSFIFGGGFSKLRSSDDGYTPDFGQISIHIWLWVPTKIKLLGNPSLY